MKAKKQTKKLLREGGLNQEGGTTDPVSGNDVPVGSTQEEVRDDIPAQLSEGEFVFPADVVRFIGLDNLMKLRQEAKSGLAKMDRMGQMGNSEEAVEDDTGEFDTDIDDIIGEIEREARMAKPEEEEQTEEEPPVKKLDEERLGFNTGGLGTTDDSSEKEKEEEDKKITTAPTTPVVPKADTKNAAMNILGKKYDVSQQPTSKELAQSILEKKYGKGVTAKRIAGVDSTTKQDKNLNAEDSKSSLYNQIVNQNKDIGYQGKQSDKEFIFRHMAKDLSNAGIKDLKQLGYKDIEQPKVESELIKKGDKYYIPKLSNVHSGHVNAAKKPKLIEVFPEDVKTIEGPPLGLGIKETKVFGLIPQAPKRVLINKDTGEKVVQGKYGGDLNQQQDTTQPIGYGLRSKAKPLTDLESWEMANDPRRGLRWGNTTSVDGMANYMISFDEKGQAVVFPQYADTGNENFRNFAYAVAAGAAVTYGPSLFAKASSKISSTIGKKITKEALVKKAKEKIIKKGVKTVAKNILTPRD